jgi:hypothetical protein
MFGGYEALRGETLHRRMPAAPGRNKKPTAHSRSGGHQVASTPHEAPACAFGWAAAAVFIAADDAAAALLAKTRER